VQQNQLNKKNAYAHLSHREPTAKAKATEDDHTAGSLAARLVPTQALLKAITYSSHSVVACRPANQRRVQ